MGITDIPSCIPARSCLLLAKHYINFLKTDKPLSEINLGIVRKKQTGPDVEDAAGFLYVTL